MLYMRTFLYFMLVLILYSGIYKKKHDKKLYEKNKFKIYIYKSVPGGTFYNNLDLKPLKLSTYHSCSADLGLS